MPKITIVHKLHATAFKGCPIVIYDSQDANAFMQKILARNIDVVILTGIDCDEVRAPCGCYGYDGVCCWHRGSSDDDFADCLCSRKYDITCNYHK